MVKCKYCGTEFTDGTNFCPTCGAKTDEIPVVEAITEDKYKSDSQAKNRKLHGGMLAWAIVNTVLGCCNLSSFILGIIAIVFTAQASSCKTDADEANRLRTAKILNIIGTVVIAIHIILFIIITAAAGFGLFNVNTIPYRYHYFWD